MIELYDWNLDAIPRPLLKVVQSPKDVCKGAEVWKV